MRKISINAKVEKGVIVGNFPIITVSRNGETRQELDNSCYGTLFELLIANIANSKDCRQELKSQGRADVKFHYNYDVKQASSPIKYGEKDFIFGSSRLIYSPYIKYNIIDIIDGIATVQVDIKQQTVYCITKKDFLEIINKLGLFKANKSRDTVNINTVWNYTKNKPHSVKKLNQFIELLNEYNLTSDELYNKIMNV